MQCWEFQASVELHNDTAHRQRVNHILFFNSVAFLNAEKLILDANCSATDTIYVSSVS